MFGTQSNIMLFENNQGIDQFKKNKKNDEDFRLADYDRKYDLSFQKFMESENAPGKFIPAFDKNISEYLDRKNYNTLAATEKYDLISETLGDLENPEVYYVTERNDVTRFTLFKPSEKPHAAFRQVNEALNHFYKSGIHNFQLKTEKTKHAVSIRHAIDKAEKYIRQAQLKLDVIRNNINFKQVADNLMAHLNSIPEGAEKVTLTDVYSGKEIEIRLKSGLSAQKNAELYYRKSKNQDIEIGKLQSAIEEKKISIHKLATRLEELENIRDLKELRKSGMIPDKKTPGDNPSKQSVFREFSCQGYRILIGKSSVNNDSLTFGEGVKEDLWMHARDVPGSHVLVKYQSGKVFPQPVIERAAELAAYFSKNRNNTLCPVIYTPRKYVRKRKGAPAGQVIVEREEIIMVRPKL
jgi:predicted ribosome quality control (RQC) complex YloA/Tae2 family protein